MSIFAIVLILQVLCAVHVVRTGRPYFWIFIVVFLPAVGLIAYLIAEILPELLGSPRAQRAAGGVAKALDPGRTVREAERQLQITASAHNKAALADAYLAVNRVEEAVGLYREATTGIYATDPAMLFGFARALLAHGDYAEAQRVLEDLREANPGYTSQEAHLVYAKALEAQGKVAEALHEYEYLAPTYPGQEAKYRYAMLLREAGHDDEAQQILKDIVQAETIAPRHVRREQREWFALARRQLGE